VTVRNERGRVVADVKADRFHLFVDGMEYPIPGVERELDLPLSLAFVVDTSGAGVGLWQPDQFPGLTVLSEPGTPSWFELLTRDFTAATAFYRDVFGWDLHVLSDTPEFRYQALRAPDGDGFLAGVMDAATLLPDGVPSYWGLYLGVEDAEAAVSRAVGLGASVVHAVKDTPYGRLAAIADPNGALITLVARTASGSATG